MLTAFSIFRLWNVFYQAIATFLVYGMSLFWSTVPALFREWIRILIILITLIYWFSKIKSYRKYRKQIWIVFSFLIIISVLLSLFISHATFSNIFIWIKYWFQRTFVLLSATFFGFVFSNKRKQTKFFQYLPRVLVSIVLIGFLWQWAKLLRPDFFHTIWYGKLDDYYYGTNPPIYYLTTFEWTLRRQWLFSGPNNYGYFLVAFLPLVRSFFIKNIQKKEKSELSIIALLIRFAWMIATLSRSVLVWMVVVFITMFRKQLKKNKKLILRWWIWIFLALIWLSALKRQSTLWHIASKLNTIPEVISTPLWHWLGSSWPAVHYEWKFLPENYYLQIMLDIWTIGFIFRVITMLYLFRTQYKIIHQTSSKDFQLSESEENQTSMLHKMQIWLLALFVMWLFLHVFEDSMVNYLFFTVYGILLWSLSSNLKGELWWKIKFEK